MNVEGKNPVKEILSSGKQIEKIIIADGTNDAELREIFKSGREKGIKVEFANRKLLDKLSTTGHHQGVIAVQADYEYFDLDEVLKTNGDNPDATYVVLDEILDPHNLGSIIRVAECAGVTAIIIPNRRSALVNETVIRASAGATAYVPVVKVSNLNSAIEKLKENGVWVYGLDMDGKTIYDEEFSGKIAIVVGGEGTGIKALTKKLCDEVISIPMFGKVNSLNASVSAGIAIYEVVRQRSKKS